MKRREKSAGTANEHLLSSTVTCKLEVMSYLNLPNVALALKNYDEQVSNEPVFQPSMGNVEWLAWNRKKAELAVAVGEAFATDVGSTDGGSTFRSLVRPEQWVRELVAKYEQATNGK